MEITLIRHLKTPGNQKRQYIGSTDENLAPEEKCRFESENRKKLYPKVEQVIISPMKRCIQTAELIYPEMSPQIETSFRECDFGIFEGRTYEGLKDEPEYQAWLDSGGTIAFPKGEEQTEFRERCVQGMIRQIHRLCEEQVSSAAFVVHGGTIMAVLERLAKEQQDFYHWQVENGNGYRMVVKEEEWKSGEGRFYEIHKLKMEKEMTETERREKRKTGGSDK